MNAAGMVIAVVLALLTGWWLGRRLTLASARVELAGRDAERAVFKDRAENLERQFVQQKAELETARQQAADSRIDATRLQAQVDVLADARKQLTDTFKLAAADVLKDTNTAFLGIANDQFSAKENAIHNLLTPVRDTLDKMEAQTRAMETARAQAYTGMLTEIQNIQQTHESLRKETTQLVQALRSPKARGNWGELQLKRCIEFAGMVEHCSFDTEVFLRAGDDPAQRPDVVVQLPNGRAIVIDAKTPLDAYLSAMNATDELQRTVFLKSHAARVRMHLSQLADKRYWQRFHNSPDFVVCFLPSEVLFSAALEQEPDLIEFGSQGNVILATPTTLIALLKAVAYGWQQMAITRNAIAICKAGDDLYKKLAGTQEHFTRLGNALCNSVKHFNSLVGAVEGKGSVFSLASKLHQLGIGHEEIPETNPIEAVPRSLQSEHWDVPIALAAGEETPDESTR